jgi:hypothetical protein
MVCTATALRLLFPSHVTNRHNMQFVCQLFVQIDNLHIAVYLMALEGAMHEGESKSFWRDIQKPHQMENAERDI